MALELVNFSEKLLAACGIQDNMSVKGDAGEIHHLFPKFIPSASQCKLSWFICDVYDRVALSPEQDTHTHTDTPK